jgi:hypothetical protein
MASLATPRTVMGRLLPRGGCRTRSPAGAAPLRTARSLPGPFAAEAISPSKAVSAPTPAVARRWRLLGIRLRCCRPNTGSRTLQQRRTSRGRRSRCRYRSRSSFQREGAVVPWCGSERPSLEVAGGHSPSLAFTLVLRSPWPSPLWKRGRRLSGPSQFTDTWLKRGSKRPKFDNLRTEWTCV